MSWNLGLAHMPGTLARLPAGKRLLALAPGTEALGAASGPILVDLLASGALGNAVALVAIAFLYITWQSGVKTKGV